MNQEKGSENEDDMSEPQMPSEAKCQGLTYHLDVEENKGEEWIRDKSYSYLGIWRCSSIREEIQEREQL